MKNEVHAFFFFFLGLGPKRSFLPHVNKIQSGIKLLEENKHYIKHY